MIRTSDIGVVKLKVFHDVVTRRTRAGKWRFLSLGPGLVSTWRISLAGQACVGVGRHGLSRIMLKSAHRLCPPEMSSVMEQASEYGDEKDGVEANFSMGHALRNGGADHSGRGEAARSLGSRVSTPSQLVAARLVYIRGLILHITYSFSPVKNLQIYTRVLPCSP